MRRTNWYHVECLAEVANAVRTGSSPQFGLCARCGLQGEVMEAELVSGEDVRVIGEARVEREVAGSIPVEVVREGPENGLREPEEGEEPDVVIETEPETEEIEEEPEPEEDEVIAEAVEEEVQKTVEQMTDEELRARIQELEEKLA